MHFLYDRLVYMLETNKPRSLKAAEEALRGFAAARKDTRDYPSLAQDRGEQPKACVDQR
jgi:hypothetical protein